MGGGPAGGLNVLLPRLNRLIWPYLPKPVRRGIIKFRGARFEKRLQRDCLDATAQVAKYNETAAKLAPKYEFRHPVVDYRRQAFRGTLVEGREYYVNTAEAQQRLSNIFAPYSEEELAERQKHAQYK